MSSQTIRGSDGLCSTADFITDLKRKTMKSFTVIFIALLALGTVSCTQEDSIANEEALFDMNDRLTLETKANTGNTGTGEDPPED